MNGAAAKVAVLKIARQLAIWFHRTYCKQPTFNAGPFKPPQQPQDAGAALREEMRRDPTVFVMKLSEFIQKYILLMAIACDLTRVANLHYLTNKVVFSWVGAAGGTHHDISHRQKSQSDNLPALDAINTWYATQVVYIVDRLKAMPDVDGRTVFDNTILVWANELALGSHKFERAPYMLVAGKFPLPKGLKL